MKFPHENSYRLNLFFGKCKLFFYKLALIFTERKLDIYYKFSLILTVGGPILFFSFLIFGIHFGRGGGGEGGFGVGLLVHNMMTVFSIFLMNSFLASAVMVLIFKKRKLLYTTPFFIQSVVVFIYVAHTGITSVEEYYKHKNRSMTEVARQCDFEELQRRLSKPIYWKKDEDGRENSIYHLLNCNGVTTVQIHRLHESGATVGSKELFFVSRTSPDLVDELIQLGVNVNDRNSDGLTALMMARSLNIVELLIKAGADVNAVDKKGRTVLMYAEDGLVTKTLFEAGANPLILDNDGNNALSYGADDRGYDIEKNKGRIKLLVNAGVDINHVNKNGETPLIRAFKNEYKCIDELVENGANINFPDKDGKTPLMYILDARNKDWLWPMFIQHGVKVNLADNKGRTALHYSIQRECRESLSSCWAAKLIGAGSDVNRSDNDGNTPLHEATLASLSASTDNDSNIMRRLRIAGADINKKNNKGQTPLDLVKEKFGDNYKESDAYKILTQDIEQLKKEARIGD